MTNPQLQQILEDLYAIDPELRSYEAELLPLVQTLLAGKRNPKPTKEFAAQLRRILQERAATLSAKTSMADTIASFFQSKTSFAVLGAFLAVAIGAPTMYVALKGADPMALPPMSDTDMEESAMRAYDVAPTAPEAFGKLGVSATAPQANPRPQSGGGGGDAAMSSLIFPPGPMYSYTYEYAGEEIALPESDTVNVLRRKQVQLPASSVSLPPLDIIDMGTFRDSRVTNVSLSQDSKNGYMVTLDLQEGSVSIYQNYERWDDPFRNCNGDQSCYDRLQLSLSDVPSDDTIITIADRFLQEHGIDTSRYGAGAVDHQWKVNYENTPEADRRGMVPDTLAVIYPFTINGTTVYEQYGSPMGISVNVNLRNKAVTGAWNIMVHQYDESAYPAVKSAQQITDFIERMNNAAGDMRIMMAEQEGAGETEETVVKLGTPTQGFARYYRSKDNGSMEQLLVPALIFPVAETVNPPSYYSPTPVVVPLASELLEEAEGQGQPMPLMMQ
jgi:hypothetical protein